MKRNKIIIAALIGLILSGVTITSFAGGSEKDKKYLFKIERSRDADVVIYEANLMEDGSLNQKNPIIIYWKKFTTNGKTEPLTKVQNSLSYGLKFLEVTSNETEFQLMAFEQSMTLRKNAKGDYKVYSRIGNQEMEVERIYVWFSNKSYWFPKVGRVELYTKTANTPEILAKVITP
jgi:tRNA(Ile2) C34 agmatinyltransferase TiaS